ncbi:MAG: hypothetical protein AAGL49_14500, partial [Pseudomonadota bacterium]
SMGDIRIGPLMNETVSFGLKRWGVVLRVAWAPMLATAVVAAAALFLAFGPVMNDPELVAVIEGLEDETDMSVITETMQPYLGTLAPAMILGLVVIFIAATAFYGMIAAPISRLVILGEEPQGIFHLRFTGPAARYAVTQGLLILIGLLMFGLVFAVTGAVAMTGGEAGEPPGALSGLGLGLFLAAPIVLILVNVRLLPMSPGSAAEDRILLLAAWRMTKGRFWALFGAAVVYFLLVLGIAMGVQIAMSLVQGVGVLVTGLLAAAFGGGGAFLSAVVGALIAFVLLIANAIYLAFSYALQIAFPAIIYRELSRA